MSRGDENACRTFYNAYFSPLLRYLLVVARGDEEAAREALHLAFVRASRHIKPFQTEPALWGWLTLLARSAFTDEYRKRSRYFAFLQRFFLHTKTERALARDPGSGDRLNLFLEKALATLPGDEQSLIEQKYFAKQSVRDIATAQQTTEKTIESKLSRIRRKLKQAILDDLEND